MSTQQSKGAKRIQIYNAKAANRIDQLLSKEPEHISVMTGMNAGSEKLVCKPQVGFRHKFMSDENVKFVYSKVTNVLHDKSCPHVKDMAEHNMVLSTEYQTDKRQCPDCRLKAYIRNSGDIADYDAYVDFFERTGINEDVVYDLFVRKQAKSSIFFSALTLHLGSDVWKIKLVDKFSGKVILLHNNSDEQDGEKPKTEGFHTVLFNVPVEEALTKIEMHNLTVLQQLIKKVAEVASIKNNLKKAKNLLNAIKGCVTEKIRQYKSRTIYYVDGDNDPCKRIQGIERLSSRDRVKVFSAANNGYYNIQKHREELLNTCKCKVKFITVTPGDNAVDFAIAMDAYAQCKRRKYLRVYLISKDKHFDVINTQLKDFVGEAQVGGRKSDIKEASRKEVAPGKPKTKRESRIIGENANDKKKSFFKYGSQSIHNYGLASGSNNVLMDR